MDSEKVSIEKVDARNWNLERLRFGLALVGQEPVHLILTVKRDVSFDE